MWLVPPLPRKRPHQAMAVAVVADARPAPAEHNFTMTDHLVLLHAIGKARPLSHRHGLCLMPLGNWVCMSKASAAAAAFADAAKFDVQEGVFAQARHHLVQ